jgi:hypothetical protein
MFDQSSADFVVAAAAKNRYQHTPGPHQGRMEGLDPGSEFRSSHRHWCN